MHGSVTLSVQMHSGNRCLCAINDDFVHYAKSRRGRVLRSHGLASSVEEDDDIVEAAVATPSMVRGHRRGLKRYR